MSSIELSIRPRDLGNIARGLHGNTTNAAIYAAGRKLKDEVLRRRLVPFRKGGLYDSMKVTTSDGNVNVSFTAPHALVVDVGARAHTIDAVNHPTLTFRIGGQWKRPKSVSHPGFQGRGYALKVARLLRDMLVDEFKSRIKRL